MMKKKVFFLLFLLLSTSVLMDGCGSQESSAPSQEAENKKSEWVEEENGEMKMNVNVNGQDFTATLEQNSAVSALVQMMENGPVTLQLSDYAGFEKVGPLGQSLPASNSQTTTQSGDIVLYQGNQIVMFYGSNSWSYTRIGRIDDLTGWEEALVSGDVTVTLSVED
ncbi:cyclophilin-like fold protein [uncultured Merdimonas sp.]|uniref:cyclophilin-like fold protein n=1 Tax=uncultured Merdimonas sp. TaxID=2023269 RepID=UPI00320805CA